METLKRLFEHFTNTGQTDRAKEIKDKIVERGGKVQTSKKVKKMEEESEEESEEE